ncbi:hypothetical protein CWI42_051310 [Ordospora colligata]|uniref:EF-hand domain-containing protein n=1 Tax=Ordospora colligata OC4 TaxID=1354746 RepID=A0A0B2UL37_9MICR|nr:uncharacterized protein M896_051360 [Ordospora colligata OC4]KHN69727.1 hypothetical protein M896_051360 [Ordospora colligata OC4]TBU15530.1 hypothetical protein CWI41_051350 [Ordospora colligata]TBU15693.1 hypothetical protein CWI40_051340 [Ordospora colligata]TBU18648.1 hypothetical protein CWI42_051310 [Ordospora colligata]
MSEDSFDWLGGDVDADADEFIPAPNRSLHTNYLIDILGGMFYSILGVSLGLRLMLYAFGADPYVLGLSLNVILMSITVGSLLFIVLAILRDALTLMVINMRLIENSESNTKLQKLAMLSVWILCCMYWLRYVKIVYGYQFDIARRIFVAALITSIAYSVTTLAIAYFETFFMKRTLHSKLDDVKKSERILCAMKNYRYDISESVSMATPECSCKDMFCFRMASAENAPRGRSGECEEGFHKFAGGLRINPPELHGVMDSKTLARDVFVRASKGKEELSFDDFSVIFPSVQDALNAFAFFDSNNDRMISKKEFQSTIVYFYMERVNLERNVKRAEDFIRVIANTLISVVFACLCFTYMIVFGIPLKELLALALSGALAFNLVASGIVSDVYYNFMMLISHQFDVGDDVVVDGVDYKVYEFGLSNTSLVGENGGKIKLLNSDLWKKNLINMTRAPEKIIVFNFELDPNIEVDTFMRFKVKIHEFVKSRPFDYDDSFSLQAKTEGFTSIDVLSCLMILKCKGYKNKSKKFLLRVEMTTFLRSLIAVMGIAAPK